MWWWAAATVGIVAAIGARYKWWSRLVGWWSSRRLGPGHDVNDGVDGDGSGPPGGKAVDDEELEEVLVHPRKGVPPRLDPSYLQYNPLEEIGDHCRRSLVVDVGSEYIRCGFSDEDTPCAWFPSIVARCRKSEVEHPHLPFLRSVVCGSNGLRCFVGEVAQEAVKVQSSLEIIHPNKHGKVVHAEAIEAILMRIEVVLNVSVRDQPLLLVTSLQSDRERLCQILFEQLQLRSAVMLPQESLSIFAHKKWSGLSVHVGGGYSMVVPVYMGCTIPHASRRYSECGRTLSNHLMQTIHWRLGGIACEGRSARQEIINNITASYLSADMGDREEQDVPAELELVARVLPPDRTEACELFFRSENGITLQSTVLDSLHSLPVEMRSFMLENIVISGGCAGIRNFGSRLQLELQNALHGSEFEEVQVQVLSGHPDNSIFETVRELDSSNDVEPVPLHMRAGSLPFVGASMLCRSSVFEGMCMSDVGYDSYGFNVVSKMWL